MKHIFLFFIGLILLACTDVPLPKTPFFKSLKQSKAESFISDNLFHLPLNEKEKLLAYAIDTFYKKANRLNVFNGAVLVSMNNKVLYNNALGLANKQLNYKLSTQTSFELASVSKQFTAVAILKLVNDGKIALGDSIQKFIPKFPYRGILILDLLSHRSGLPNYTSFCEEYTLPDSVFLSNEDVLNILISKRPAIYNAPNRSFGYCNTNYILLAHIVSLISKQSFPEYMQEQIFIPLGMKNSFIKDKLKSILPNEAQGYNTRFEKYNFDKYDGVYGDKGVFASVEDMYRWDNMLRTEILLPKYLIKKAFTPYSFERIGKRNYGLGFRMLLNEGNAPDVVYHNGWWHGYRTLFYKNLKYDITIVALQNTTGRFVYNIGPIVNALLGKAEENENYEDESGLE